MTSVADEVCSRPHFVEVGERRQEPPLKAGDVRRAGDGIAAHAPTARQHLVVAGSNALAGRREHDLGDSIAFAHDVDRGRVPQNQPAARGQRRGSAVASGAINDVPRLPRNPHILGSSGCASIVDSVIESPRAALILACE